MQKNFKLIIGTIYGSPTLKWPFRLFGAGLGYCLVGAVVVLCFFTCDFIKPQSNIIDGDNNPRDEVVFNGVPISRIHLYNNCNAQIDYDETVQNCKITINPNLKGYLKSTIKDSLLTIRLDPNFLYTNVHLDAFIKLKSIKVIQCEDSSRVSLDGFLKQDSTACTLSTGSKLSGSFKINTLSLYCTGGSVDSVRGEGRNLIITAYGGRILMGDYTCSVVRVMLDNASSGRVKVSDTLIPKLDNVSILYYKPVGDPVIKDSVILNNSSLERDTVYN